MMKHCNPTKLLLFLSVLSLAAVFISAHDSHVFSLPFFIWSDESEMRFKGGREQVFTTTEAEEAQSLLEEIINGFTGEDTKLTKLLANHEQPSTMVIFVAPQMRTDLFSRLSNAYGKVDGGAFKNLKDTLEKSSSSLSLPYVKLDEPFSATLESTLSLSSDRVEVKIALPASSLGSHSFQKRFGTKAKYLNHETLLTELTQHKSNGGKRTVYVVGFEEELPQESELRAFFAKHDELIGAVDRTLKNSAQEKYVGMFSAERAFTNDWKMETVRTTSVEDYISFKYLEAMEESDFGSGNNSTALYDDHWPPEVWEGMIVSLLLILIILIGVACTCGIQIPKMFLSPSAALNYKKQL